MSHDDEVTHLTHARARVLERISDACARAGRDPAAVTLVAVSKTVPAARLRAAVAAGLDLLGENRVQEALDKVPEVPGARWHLVGPLQANKARRAIQAFDVIETVGTVELAQRLDRLAGELDRDRVTVLLQVNVDRDPAKAGFDPDGLVPALRELDPLGRLDVRGLMTIGREAERPEDARETFAALRELAADLRRRWPRLGPDLSMGMSGDYEIAIEEGATIVRVGRALFGERPHVHGTAGPHVHDR